MVDFPLFLLALAGGLLSFTTPCNLIAIPTFATHLMGEKINAKEGFWHSLIYGAGFCLVFTLIGMGLLFLPGFIRYQNYIQIIGGIFIMMMGLFLTLGLFGKKTVAVQTDVTDDEALMNPGESNQNENFEFATETSELDLEESSNIQNLSEEKDPLFYKRTFVLGISLGTTGFSCILPVFSTVLVILLQNQNPFESTIALLFYSLGLFLPFILVGLVFGKLNMLIMWKIVKVASKLQRIFGVVIMILGFLFIEQSLRIIGII